MFIGITGPICSGKHSIAKWLITTHGFTLLSLKNTEHYGLTAIQFNTPKDLLFYVTKNWIDNFVTCDIDNHKILELYRKRPFFLLLTVDSPITIRYQRCLFRCQEFRLPEPTLDEFVIASDQQLFNSVAPNNEFTLPITQQEQQRETSMTSDEEEDYNTTTSIFEIMSLADIFIANSYLSLPPLYSYLISINVTDSDRLRPTWDTYFMHLSDLAASRSNCMKRKVGCILVKNHRVIATGYNGTAKGLKNCNEGGCERCNDGVPCGKGLDSCLCLHAEENALLEAGKERVGVGCILYCNTCPCLGCSVKLIQVGIVEVVYNRSYGMDEKTAKILKEAGVKLRQHSSPSKISLLEKNDIEPMEQV
ncbi:2615_t:CDS:2 [Funneliformis caledonium]|uniref:Deoxycytidylate deaminase n=1 Tax=Funneliformis caledonium TaxID=1117310 RepID=A0A9N8YYC3_9GLOM|nr:2615_t:CDS:2 [Funneliformis caledonium]